MAHLQTEPLPCFICSSHSNNFFIAALLPCTWNKPSRRCSLLWISWPSKVVYVSPNLKSLKNGQHCGHQTSLKDVYYWKFAQLQNMGPVLNPSAEGKFMCLLILPSLALYSMSLPFVVKVATFQLVGLAWNNRKKFVAASSKVIY